jgi:hypothetical protein
MVVVFADYPTIIPICLVVPTLDRDQTTGAIKVRGAQNALL